jgi:hypothetical protein
MVALVIDALTELGSVFIDTPKNSKTVVWCQQLIKKGHHAPFYWYIV